MVYDQDGTVELAVRVAGISLSILYYQIANCTCKDGRVGREPRRMNNYIYTHISTASYITGLHPHLYPSISPWRSSHVASPRCEHEEQPPTYCGCACGES